MPFFLFVWFELRREILNSERTDQGLYRPQYVAPDLKHPPGLTALASAKSASNHFAGLVQALGVPREHQTIQSTKSLICLKPH